MSMRFPLVLLLFGAWMAAPAAAQRPLKIFISVDMEGIDGVATRMQAAGGGSEYEKYRRLMTLEVNAAIEGAYQAGATEVLVADSHGNAQNVDLELLDPRASLIRAWPRALGMVHGIDSTFAAAVFVGFHASEGQSPGVLAHTFTGSVEVSLNGRKVPEAGFAGAIAGEFGVPVVFVSGDQVIAREARALFGPIETAVVKEAIGFNAAVMRPLEEARRMIREGVRRGVERRSEIRPYRIDRPVRLELRWEDPVMTEVLTLIDGVRRIDGQTVLFEGRDMIAAARFFEVVHHVRPPQ
jgi:D-amino peptidase